MDNKKVNWMFLTSIIVEIIIVLLLGIFRNHISLNITSNLIVSEMILLVPALTFVFATKTKIRDVLNFKPIKVSTVLMICLFTYLTMPLVTTLNAITMLFSKNVVEEMSADILQMPFLLMLLLMGILGPICEEVVFRGIVYEGYRKSGTVLQAMFFSAILFGFMHMNFNQALYALAIGLLLVLLKVATGSMWGSIVYHVLFNSNTVVMLYMTSKWFPTLENASEQTLDTETLIATISVFMVIATITTAIAACILVWIAKNEQREHCLGQIWNERKTGKGRMVTVPLILSFVLCLAFMTLQIIL